MVAGYDAEGSEDNIQLLSLHKVNQNVLISTHENDEILHQILFVLKKRKTFGDTIPGHQLYSKNFISELYS